MRQCLGDLASEMSLASVLSCECIEDGVGGWAAVFVADSEPFSSERLGWDDSVSGVEKVDHGLGFRWLGHERCKERKVC